jgi:hypothetical protein
MPGMDAGTRDALAGAVRAALRKVPRVVWRELAKPRQSGDEACELHVARQVVEQLEAGGWRVREPPAPAGRR